PKASNHPSSLGGGSGSRSSEDLQRQAAERKNTIAGNKEWRAAETVRREWLTELAARKTAPRTALPFILAAIAQADTHLQPSLQPGHPRARQLLGLPKPENTWDTDTKTITDLLAKAGANRANVIALTLVLGAYEGETSTQTWRHPAAQQSTARYL